MAVVSELTKAIVGGAEVINLSSSLYWQVVHGRPPVVASAQDSARVLRTYRLVRDHLKGIERFLATPFPVVVLPAGNDGVDAFWAALPNLKNDFPDHVVVVGGTEHQSLRPDSSVDIASFSNDGPLVDVAAPAVDVYSLDKVNSITPADGTSYAAPLVAGAAGLLLSADPSLATRDLKDLIVRGAVEAGRSAVKGGQSYPLLNAHAAMKLAARRTGGPLCGNAVITDGTRLLVDRGGTWDHIADLQSGPMELEVRHGGVIDVSYQSGHEDRFSYVNGTWTAGPIPDDSSDPGGFVNSVDGLSHDALTSVSVQPLGSGFWDVIVDGPRGRQNFTHSEPINSNVVQECIRRDIYTPPWGGDPVYLRCQQFRGISNGGSARVEAAMSPDASKVILVVNRSERSESIGEWTSCGIGNTYCRYVTVSISSTNGTAVEIDIQTGTKRTLFQTPHWIAQLGVSEDGTEMVLSRYDSHSSAGGTSRTACSIEVRSVATGQLITRAPFERTCTATDPGLDLSYRIMGHGS